MFIGRISLFNLQDLSYAIASGERCSNFPIRMADLYKQVTQARESHFIGIILEFFPEFPYDTNSIGNIVVDSWSWKFQIYFVCQGFEEGCGVARSFVKGNPIRFAIMDGRPFPPGLLLILT